MPRENAYCTLFDRSFAARGLALYRSLERCEDGDFRMYAVCMDDESRELLDRLDAPRLVTVGLGEVEAWDRDLAAVRPSRTAAEYCWTAAPAACRFVLHREPSIPAVTYLDADLLFFGSPEGLFDELGEGSVLLIPHRLADPRHELAQGTYNVGWNTFRRDANGVAALRWWRERCLEWCHGRVEPGRFGDQKYLDELPRRFAGVRACANPGAGLGPWNQARHRIQPTADGAFAVDGHPIVFCHYSGLGLHPPGGALGALARRLRVSRHHEGPAPFEWTVRGRTDPRLMDLVWAPYVECCAQARAELARVGAPPSLGLQPLRLRSVVRAAVRDRAPEWLRGLHLAFHQRVLRHRATHPPRLRRRPARSSGGPRWRRRPSFRAS